jgi:predicted AAA+ superfamily ATPase
MGKKELLQRPEYLNWLKSWRERQVIKVVSGVRRCGKSTLFQLYTDYLLGEGITQEQIIFINLEELEYEELLDYHVLYKFIKDRLNSKGYTYIFIDEVQNCKGFEKVVDSLFVKENVDIYITGSNAYMLSGELATLLSGRYVQIEMLPFSFAEYVSYHSETSRSNSELFMDYVRYGAFPAVVALDNNERLINSYLDGVYNSILLKDVAARYGMSDITMLESIVRFLYSSVGSSISVKKIADTINSSGRKTSVNTVDKYLSALCESYMFYKVNRYDIRGREYLKTLCKYYAIDSGMRELKLSSSSSDIGHVLENIVYLELLRRGNAISIGKLDEKEIDFVAENAEGKTYYQVSATVLDANTREREFAPLRKIKDFHPRLLITMDELPRVANYDGIRQVNIIDWLLDI